MSGQGAGQRQAALYDGYQPYLRCRAQLRKFRPSDGGGPRGRVAVCLVGQARTLVKGTGGNGVRESLMRHLLRPLAANGTVDVFVRIKAPAVPGPAATAHALRGLFDERPRENLRLASLVVEGDPPVQVPPRPSCNSSAPEPHAHWSAPKIMASCYAQIRGAHDCLQDVRREERESDVTYDLVVRARADLEYSGPFPPLNKFPLDAITTAGGQSDIITVVPREHLDTLSAAYEDYHNCNGGAEHASSSASSMPRPTNHNQNNVGKRIRIPTCGTGRAEDVTLLSYLSRNVTRCAFRDLGAYSTPKIRRGVGRARRSLGSPLGGAGEVVVDFVAAPAAPQTGGGRFNVEAWAAAVPVLTVLCAGLLRARHRAWSAGREVDGT